MIIRVKRKEITKHFSFIGGEDDEIELEGELIQEEKPKNIERIEFTGKERQGARGTSKDMLILADKINELVDHINAKK